MPAIAVAHPSPRQPGMTEKPISTVPSSSGGPKYPPAPARTGGPPDLPLQSAYQTYHPAASAPPSSRRSRKYARAFRSYSPGGHPGSTRALRRDARHSGDSSSAERCSGVAAIISREPADIATGLGVGFMVSRNKGTGTCLRAYQCTQKRGRIGDRSPFLCGLMRDRRNLSLFPVVFYASEEEDSVFAESPEVVSEEEDDSLVSFASVLGAFFPP